MNDKTPNIRFKGFTDDWEQEKATTISRAHYYKMAIL